MGVGRHGKSEEDGVTVTTSIRLGLVRGRSREPNF